MIKRKIKTKRPHGYVSFKNHWRSHMVIFLFLSSVPMVFFVGCGPSLIDLTKTGNVDGVQTKLAKNRFLKKVDINAKDKEGNTALILATEKGYTEIVHALLSKGADINAKGKYGYTALILAAEKGYTEIVHALLSKGADVNAKNISGYTALISAAQRHYTIEIVDVLLSKGADVNAKDDDGQTALMLAAKYGPTGRDSTKMVDALLSKGADVNAKDKDGQTALMLAVKYDHPEIMHALLFKGADVNAKDKDGQTALMLAVKYDHPEIMHALLFKGADVNAKDKDGQTALIWALYRLEDDWKAKDIVKALLSKGANPNVPYRYVTYGGVNMGITIEKQSGGGYSTFSMKENYRDLSVEGPPLVAMLHKRYITYITSEKASRVHYDEVIRLLLDAGADVNARDSLGRTALLLAGRVYLITDGTDLTDIMQTLLSKGAEIGRFGDVFEDGGVYKEEDGTTSGTYFKERFLEMESKKVRK